MDERRLELNVGLLALVALAIGAGLVVLLSGVTGKPTFVFHADFGYAGGLPSGAQVKIAGVKVGRVKEVAFRPEVRDEAGRAMPVRLTLEIDRAASSALRADAVATVGQQGALGESYVEVLPGTAAGQLHEGEAVRGLDPPRLDLVLARFFTLLESATTDDAFRNFLVEVARLAHTIDQFARGNRDQLAQFFRDTLQIMGDAKVAMVDVRVAARSAAGILTNPELHQTLADLSAASRTARAELPGLLTDTHQLVANLEKTTGALTPDDVGKIRATLARYDQLGQSLQKVSANADLLLEGVQKGEGTLGKVAKDPKVYEDLRALLADLKAHPWKFLWKD